MLLVVAAMVSKRSPDSNDLKPKSWVHCTARISAARVMHLGAPRSLAALVQGLGRAESREKTVVFRSFGRDYWRGVYSESQLGPAHNGGFRREAHKIPRGGQ